MISPLTHLTDFPDRLSPMLVKELRQGMRARSFVLLFLIFQLLLCFILLTAGSAANAEDSGSIASGVIFTMFIIAVLFIQPMRGVTALSGEISGNTIEMMVLTRLSASRIVFGKWIAIVSQSALILITIIPYLILRYFFGGMLLLGEMVFLTLIFLTSMALTAVMVGLSGTATKLVRALPILSIFFIFQIFTLGFGRGGGFNGFMNLCTLSTWQSQLSVLAYLCFIGYFGWCALSFGISAIAPVAENHSTIRRLIALALAGITAVIGLHQDVFPYVIPIIFGIILAPAVITALTEPANLVPPICKPFTKFGIAGRIAGLFLLPGWAAGAFFTILLILIGMLGTSLAFYNKPGEHLDIAVIIVALAFIGGLLFPALLAALFSKQENKRFTNFMLFLLGSVALTLIPSIFANIDHHEKYLWLFVWNPPVLLAMVDEYIFDKNSLLMAIIVVDSIYAILLLITAAMAFRHYRPIFEEAENEPSATPLPTTIRP